MCMELLTIFPFSRTSFIIEKGITLDGIDKFILEYKVGGGRTITALTKISREYPPEQNGAKVYNGFFEPVEKESKEYPNFIYFLKKDPKNRDRVALRFVEHRPKDFDCLVLNGTVQFLKNGVAIMHEDSEMYLRNERTHHIVTKIKNGAVTVREVELTEELEQTLTRLKEAFIQKYTNQDEYDKFNV